MNFTACLSCRLKIAGLRNTLHTGRKRGGCVSLGGLSQATLDVITLYNAVIPYTLT